MYTPCKLRPLPAAVLLISTAVGGGGLRGADVALVPVSASGVHTIEGNEIRLTGGGQRVVLELQISDWDPDLDGTPRLSFYQLPIDSSGYTSGLSGTLSPAAEACTTSLDCHQTIGGVCRFTNDACRVDTDCPFHSIGETCSGPSCGLARATGRLCDPGFILTDRMDYLFTDFSEFHAAVVDLATLDYRFAAVVRVEDAAADTGAPAYAGTLVLDVPPDAFGTFVVRFKMGAPGDGLGDANRSMVLPLNLTPARITVARLCRTPSDCDDRNGCTDDDCACPDTRCESGPVCSNQPNFDPAGFCCQPESGAICRLPAGRPGDFNGDGRTDLADFAILQRCFGKFATAGACAGMDTTCACGTLASDVAAFVSAMNASRLP